MWQPQRLSKGTKVKVSAAVNGLDSSSAGCAPSPSDEAQGSAPKLLCLDSGESVEEDEEEAEGDEEHRAKSRPPEGKCGSLPSEGSESLPSKSARIRLI